MAASIKKEPHVEKEKLTLDIVKELGGDEVLASLRYLAKGDFYSEVADIHGISRSSFCRILHEFVRTVNTELNNIKFPSNEQLTEVKRSFYRKCKIPNVIGAVDGSQIPIIAPSHDEAVYVCRKGYHSLNIQAVVDTNMRFINAVTKWPGSMHDSAIFENCALKDDLNLLNDISDRSDSEVDNTEEDLDAEPIKKDEIRDFIKKLGIYQHRPEQEGKEKESAPKKKLLVAKTDDEDSATTPSTSEIPKSKKNKEKNKFKVQHDEVSSTTKDPAVEYKTHIKSYQKRRYLLIKAGDYFDNQDVSGAETRKCSDEMVQQMEEFASKLLNDEITVYNKQRENTKRSDVSWMKTVLTSGTLADKIAALTVLIQESALHSLFHLDTLISMAKKKGRRENVQATDALKEIFLTSLIPDDRKLQTFAQHNIMNLGPAASWNKDVMDKKLIMWYFEAQLKTRYAEFVKILEGMAHDTVLSTKQKTVSIIYNLLVNKPEQEKALLNLLINKVGDPHYKLASTVSNLLTKLVEHHPNMKGVVVREVEYLLFRPNIAERAQYYSVCFLNQLRLSHDEKELASKLISIYFAFFKAFVKKGEVDSKMMSALLTGVNRAYPYAKLDEKILGEKLEHLYKIVHIVNFSTSIQALSLLYQVMDAGQNISERYYSALYKKLLDPALKTSSKQAVFLNLLYKSLKKDESERRLKAFVKRLLQVCSYQQPQFTCGALVLLSEVLREKPGLLSLTHAEEESDEEEHFVDQPDPEEDITTQASTGTASQSGSQIPERKHKKPSWVHRANLNHKSEQVDYDPFHRNPQYCHAENECIWELENLALHFHPSVSLFAKQILKGEIIKYTGDPLNDFTLIRFLDRFVYKNPKKKEQIEEKAFSMSRKQLAPSGIKGLPVTSEQFLQLDEKRVPVDDIFLHRFFQQKAVKEQKKGDEDSDVESVTDAEFDDFLDTYEGKLEENDLSDFDIDFSSEFGKKSKTGEGDSDDENDDDLDDDLSDEEIDFDEDDELAKAFKDEMEDSGDEEDDDFGDDDDDDLDNEDFADADDYADEIASDEEEPGGFNEEDIEFSDNDDEFADFVPKGKKRKATDNKHVASHKRKKPRHGGEGGLSAAAEQFSSMIDDTAGSKMNMIGSEALANTDKADVKQLKWEVERDRWMHDRDKKSFRKGGRKFSKGNKGGGGQGKNKSGKAWQGKNKGQIHGIKGQKHGNKGQKHGNKVQKHGNKGGKHRKGKH